MLELMIELLNISAEDTSKDNILNHFLSKSQIAIKQYCNIEVIPESLNDIIIDLAIFFYRNRDKEGVRQVSQGSRSQTLVDDIPGSIKTCLPLPKLRLM